MTKDEFYFWSTVATLIIAICALGFSFWQGYIARDHNIRSVKPCLNVIKESRADYFELKLRFRVGVLITNRTENYHGWPDKKCERTSVSITFG